MQIEYNEGIWMNLLKQGMGVARANRPPFKVESAPMFNSTDLFMQYM